MYFYLAMVGFEPKPTSTAAPSNIETTPFKEASGRECMTIIIVSVLLGAAVEVGVGSNPIARQKYLFISLSYI